MIDRRRLLLALAVAALPAWPAAAQQAARTYRIGVLLNRSPQGVETLEGYEVFADALRDAGYVEGRNLLLNVQGTERFDELRKLAADLVGWKPDLLVTYGTPTLAAIKETTQTIPVVGVAMGDPAKFVASLARPGGNLTGLSFFTPELNAKRLELLKGAFPPFRRIGFLFNSNNPGAPIKEMEAAAGSLKVELQLFGVRAPGEFESAFAAMSRQRMEAVAIVDDPMLIGYARSIADVAVKQRLPSIGFLEMAEAGGLFAYGVNLPALARRAVVYVDKILKGTKPGDLPVERATAFELVVNLKTAKAIGLAIPQDLLFRADKVIE